ncbi:MAG: hypothetical protein EGR70_12415 [[Ruminococcus] faecis]|nr:hypothetical protein [Mediterraneibacter faecis]
MNKKNFILLALCVAASVALTITLSPFDEDVINYGMVINIEIALFSVSLTIVALLITILEKYKEKVTNQSVWAQNSTKILKELCENTISLLCLLALLFLATIFKSLLILIPVVDVMTVILLFSIILSIIACFDTTISVYHLIINLKDVLVQPSVSIDDLSQKELYLIDAYRQLDAKHKEELEDLLRAFSIDQQIRTNK